MKTGHKVGNVLVLFEGVTILSRKLTHSNSHGRPRTFAPILKPLAEFWLPASRRVSWPSALSRWNAVNEEAPAVSRRSLADLYQVVGTLIIRRKARGKTRHGNRLRIALARAIVGA
jgi:hypothetical protein